MDGGKQGNQENLAGRPGRAWWQWCLAGLLFGGAGLVAIYYYVPGLRGNPTVQRVKPSRIVVSNELAEAVAVPPDSVKEAVGVADAVPLLLVLLVLLGLCTPQAGPK